jgi:opacity protein-like surface antigen
MLRSLLASAAILAAAPALAGGVAPLPAQQPVEIVPVAATSDWTGAYAGLQVDLFDGTAVLGGDFEGNAFGLFGGYRHDFGTLVIGGEIDYMVGELDFALGGLDVDSLVRLGLEVGYDAGPALIYATVGLAQLEVSQGGASGDGDGLFYGLGIDYMVSDRVTLGAEILRHEFDDFNNLPGNNLEATTFGINVAYRF